MTSRMGAVDGRAHAIPKKRPRSPRKDQMTRNRITRLLAAGGASLIAVCGLPGTAQALLFSPCLILGSPMPPPCVTLDYKKLADIATQNAQELEKVKETINTIKQAKAATDGIVSEVRDVASTRIDFSLPNVNTDMGPLLSGFKGDIAGFAGKTADAWFTGSESTTETAQKAQEERGKMIADGNIEAFAYGVQGVSEAEAANTRYAALSKKACKAKDLRTDWAVNSEIKLEVMNARARQAYLLSAFLRTQSASNSAGMNPSIAKGFKPSTVLEKAVESVASTDQSDKIRGLMDIFAKAQDIFGAIQVVQMAKSVQDSLKGVITDYEQTSAKKQAKVNELLRYAQSWVNHSGKCTAQQVVDTTLNNIGNMNSQLSALSQQSIDDLVQSGAFDADNRNLDVGALLDYDVDPRQFIGTWTDPLHYRNTENLALQLKNDDRNGAVSRCIKGDDDNEEFMNIVRGSSYENKSVPKSDPNRYVYNQGLNDLILEEAWKKVEADKAREQLAQIEGTVSEENTQQGKVVTEANATADLQALVAQANALGQAVAEGQDPGSKQRAAEILAQLQDLIGGGTGLPAVDVDMTGGAGGTGGTGGSTTPTDPDPVEPTNPRGGVQP